MASDTPIYIVISCLTYSFPFICISLVLNNASLLLAKKYIYMREKKKKEKGAVPYQMFMANFI
jgi:hypothetical protein